MASGDSRGSRAVAARRHRGRRARRSTHRAWRGHRRAPLAAAHGSLGHRPCHSSASATASASITPSARGTLRVYRRPVVEVDERAATLQLERPVGRFRDRPGAVPAVGGRPARGRRPPTPLRPPGGLRSRRAASPEPSRRCGGGARRRSKTSGSRNARMSLSWARWRRVWRLEADRGGVLGGVGGPLAGEAPRRGSRSAAQAVDGVGGGLDLEHAVGQVLAHAALGVARRGGRRARARGTRGGPRRR